MPEHPISAAVIEHTPKQAERLHAAIDRDMARIEDTARAMLTRVAGHGQTADRELEQLREIARSLHATVDRQTSR